MPSLDEVSAMVLASFVVVVVVVECVLPFISCDYKLAQLFMTSEQTNYFFLTIICVLHTMC